MFEQEDDLQLKLKVLEAAILTFRVKLDQSLDNGDNWTTGDWLNEFDAHFSITTERIGTTK